jgi:hypothetical protein
MTSRWYGYNYDRERSVKDDAANIRRHIRTMVQAGLLPSDWTYSVRYRRFAGGSSIDVRATSPRPIYAADPHSDGPVKHAETGAWVTAWVDRLTSEARAVKGTLEDLVNGHNHDGSDTSTDYFDVKFYGDVVLITASDVPKFTG